MVGEMRDLKRSQLAITASETGHLVLGTLHTGTAARTLDRLLSVSPLINKSRFASWSVNRTRIISQQLIPRADGPAVCSLETLSIPGGIKRH